MSIFFPILYNVLTAIRLVQPVLIEATQTLGGFRKDVIVHAIFPATLPHLMTRLRLGISFGFRSLVGGEMIASTEGIGYAIYNAQQVFPVSAHCGRHARHWYRLAGDGPSDSAAHRKPHHYALGHDA